MLKTCWHSTSTAWLHKWRQSNLRVDVFKWNITWVNWYFVPKKDILQLLIGYLSHLHRLAKYTTLIQFWSMQKRKLTLWPWKYPRRLRQVNTKRQSSLRTPPPQRDWTFSLQLVIGSLNYHELEKSLLIAPNNESVHMINLHRLTIYPTHVAIIISDYKLYYSFKEGN